MPRKSLNAMKILHIFRDSELEDLETPPRYRPDSLDALCKATRFTQAEIKRIYRGFKAECPTGVVKEETFKMIYAQFFPQGGIIKGCGCDSTQSQNIFQQRNLIKEGLPQELKSVQMEKDWAWGGCSDDASFGENLVLKLLEDSEKYDDPRGFVSRHNNRIGREIIRENMLKICKCHGVSGSCSFQTCWMQMPTFPEIAKQLRERYDNAIMISFEKVQGAIALGNSARHLPVETPGNTLPNNLVYLEKSPDFCVSNNSTGWSGTRGRTCSRNSSPTASLSEKKSCRNLCRSCGYKVRKQQKKITTKCNCKFIWCCEVECNSCVQLVNVFSCQ